HAIEHYFPGTALQHFADPIARQPAGFLSAALVAGKLVHLILTRHNIEKAVYTNHHALLAKMIVQLVDQIRPAQRRAINRNFISTHLEDLAGICNRFNTSGHTKWNIDDFGNTPD